MNLMSRFDGCQQHCGHSLITKVTDLAIELDFILFFFMSVIDFNDNSIKQSRFKNDYNCLIIYPNVWA